MKAAVLERFGDSLSVKEVHNPTLGPNELLLRVKAAGMCGTDLHLRDGSDPEIKLPRILGHEIAGEIAEIKQGAERVDLQVGERIVASIYVTCKTCSFCRTGRDNLCARVKRIGFELDGGYAEYVKIPCGNAFKIPPDLPFPEASILPDAVAVMLHAIKNKARLSLGQSIMFQGVGGLGIHGIQIAKLCGAYVLAVDLEEERLDDARKYGADMVVNASKEDVVNFVMELTKGEGIDMVVEAVSTYGVSTDTHARVIEDAIRCVKRSGKVLIVGYEMPDFQVSPRTMFLNELEIIGCRASTEHELIEVIELVRQKKVKPVVSRVFPLHHINDALQELATGKIRGRAVILP